MKQKLKLKSKMINGWWEYIIHDYLECKFKLPDTDIRLLIEKLRPWTAFEDEIAVKEALQLGGELIVLTEKIRAGNLWLFNPDSKIIRRISCSENGCPEQKDP